MSQGDPSASLSDMLDSVNNGKIADIRNLDSKLTTETGDLLIHKDNQQTSIKGILEDSALNDVFFSDMNIDALQKSIRYSVYKNTQKVIDFQPEHTLYIIMRSIMLQYGNFQVSVKNLLKEILNLNQRVVDYSSGNISSNVHQYIGYIDDIERLPIPNERPIYLNKDNYTYDISNIL